ncbi:hypothetical protein [Kribbella sp. NBC_00889]|uniref:hypothetical protein n=1 Tax=Kribbella sp. NBC_00889 TaxID=2975974 RepID=UPI00386A607B|nr:hypothetical protein OG817_40510 [Kribbella sp. NBC_00889]
MEAFEVRIAGFAGVDDALAMQETVARVLCPVPEHNGPCEPREVTLMDGTPGRFDELADQYRIEHNAR